MLGHCDYHRLARIANYNIISMYSKPLLFLQIKELFQFNVQVVFCHFLDTVMKYVDLLSAQGLLPIPVGDVITVLHSLRLGMLVLVNQLHFLNKVFCYYLQELIE